MQNYYQRIKEHIFSQLRIRYDENNGLLKQNDIDEEIENTKKLLQTDAKKYLFKDENINLNNDGFKRIKEEAEKLFDVQMEEGVFIQGDEQKQRDTTWWSNKTKLELEQNDENYYWGRYKKYIQTFLPPEVVKTVDEDTDRIVDNIGNPKLEQFDIYGMVVGHVQSGKTSNYASVICKAADAGYRFIVVIAGDKNNLRNQTQKRINEAFVGKNVENRKVGVGNFEPFRRDKLPISLTTVEKDFNVKDADKNSQGINFDNITAPILLVVKKNTSTLTNVISWLKNQYANKIPNHAMLVIDDESDYASINTKEDDDPTTINKKIRALLGIFHKSSYIAYTATPYANIFIDHQIEEIEKVKIDNKNKELNLSKDLFPRDFIYALDAPTNYFGARKIFLENRDKYIVEIDDYEDFLPIKHKKDYDLIALPNSLYEAINLFLLNVSIRNLRGDENKHNSMLVHISRFSDIHSKIALLINNYIEPLKEDIKVYGKLSNADKQSQKIRQLLTVFAKYYNHLEFSFAEVVAKLSEIVSSVVVREEHQKSKTRIEFRDDIASNIIAVGGTSLSRGFTLEGLSVSYFVRSTIFYDTLMQMGRWFGYRTDYEDLCKIYMPYSVAEYFSQIIEATEELMDSFREMAKESKTPLDFGLAVKQHPDSLLQVTARNKRKKTQKFTHSMNLNGVLKESVRFSKNLEVHKKNFQVLKQTVLRLGNNYSKSGNHYIWRDVNKKVVEEFLKNFSVFQKDQLDTLMPINFILKYLKEYNTNWDIVLYSGSQAEIVFDDIKVKTELRDSPKPKDLGSYIEIGQRKISSGTPEIVLIDDSNVLEEIKTKRFGKKGDKTRFIRKHLQRPALMLHVLKVSEFYDKLPAFGVVFPDKGINSSQTVEYVVNTVYIQSLLDEEEYDD
ncbi:Z1 domain-containing protein [Sulfurimonas sp.]